MSYFIYSMRKKGITHFQAFNSDEFESKIFLEIVWTKCHGTVCGVVVRSIGCYLHLCWTFFFSRKISRCVRCLKCAMTHLQCISCFPKYTCVQITRKPKQRHKEHPKKKFCDGKQAFEIRFFIHSRLPCVIFTDSFFLCFVCLTISSYWYTFSENLTFYFFAVCI